MMKNLFYCLLFNLVLLNAQEAAKYGKVSKEELEKKASNIDPEASGETLSEKAYYFIKLNESKGSFELHKQVEIRYKVYDKDKFENHFLNPKIKTYSSSSGKVESIYKIKASTYNLENGKIEEYKVDRKDIFEEEVNEYVTIHKFAFQNVQNGSVLEYKYEIVSPFISKIDTWYFQSEIPTIYSEMYFEYPDIFTYQPDPRGEITGTFNKNSKGTKYSFSNDILLYTFTNVPALKDEPFVFNLNNMKASIGFELVEYNNPGVTYESYATTWEQIMKDLYTEQKFGAQLKGTRYLEDKVNELTNGLTNKEDKIKAIFSFVKEYCKWNEFTGLYVDEGVRSTFKKGEGNATDINLLLTAMLQKAEIEAYPVVLSTVSNGLLNFFPSLQKLNYTIASVETPNGVLLMDATEKYSKINMIPIRALNQRGFQMRENGSYKEINLYNGLNSDIKQTLILEIEDGALKGRLSEIKTNYFAMYEIKELENTSESMFLNDYGQKYSVEKENLMTNVNSDKDAIRYNFEFTSDVGITNLGNTLLINPLLFLAQKSNPFTKEERKYILEFGTPYTHLKTCKIKIPDGYTVEEVPESFGYNLPNQVGGFQIGYKIQGEYLLVQSLEVINYSMLPQDYYAPMKKMYEEIMQKENQQILFTKNQ